MRVVKAMFGKTELEDDSFKEKVSEMQRKKFNLISTLCSTARLRANEKKPGEYLVIGNKTEGALLLMSKDHFDCNYEDMRNDLVENDDAEAAIFHKLDFSSERKRMSMVIDMDIFTKHNKEHTANTRFVSLCKGASEIMLDRCTRYLDGDEIKEISDDVRNLYTQKIEQFAGESLRTLILAYKEIDVETDDHEFMESDLILVCLVGIQDPLRPGVADAIDKCTRAGITVRMVTGDNRLTAIAISKDAHIIPEDATEEDLKKMVITGPEFAKLTNSQVDKLLPHLRCMARSSPKDKYRLVKRLKAQN